MEFRKLASYLEKLEKTSSRLEITSILTDLFKVSTVGEIDKVAYLSLGVLAPNYEGVLLNLAEKMVIKAIALASKKEINEVTSIYKKLGDVGTTAESLLRDKSHSTGYSVTDVYEKLLGIARDDGEGSQDRKIGK